MFYFGLGLIIGFLASCVAMCFLYAGIRMRQEQEDWQILMHHYESILEKVFAEALEQGLIDRATVDLDRISAIIEEKLEEFRFGDDDGEEWKR